MDSQALNLKDYNEKEIFKLEEAEAILSAYLWLSSHYPDIFTEKDLAIVLKEKICIIIQCHLENRYYLPKEELRTQSVKENPLSQEGIMSNFDHK